MQKIMSSKIAKYTIYLFIIIAYLYVFKKVSIKYLDEGDALAYYSLLVTTDIKRFIVKTTMIIALGVILALPNLFITAKREGKIRFNLTMCIIIGLPSLIIALGGTADMCELTRGMNPRIGMFLYWLASGIPRYFASFLFGYTVTSSFVKEDTSIEN